MLNKSMINIYIFHHTACESACNTLPSSATNTVSVAQGSTATPGATKQLLPLDRVFKRIIYARSTKSRDCIICSSSFFYIYIYIYIYI